MQLTELNIEYTSNRNNTNLGEVILSPHKTRGVVLVKKENWDRFIQSDQKSGYNDLTTVLKYGMKFKIVGQAIKD